MTGWPLTIYNLFIILFVTAIIVGIVIKNDEPRVSVTVPKGTAITVVCSDSETLHEQDQGDSIRYTCED